MPDQVRGENTVSTTVIQQEDSTASRLCAACGMCCDGTMFYAVHLQPNDSPKELQALGLRLKRKKKQTFFTQPCAAYRGTNCSIYEARPQRCRLFDCQQIRRVAAGETTEAKALEKIGQAREQVAAVRSLLLAAGSTNLKRSLATRYEAATAQPIEAESDLQALELRHQLIEAMEKLEALLTSDFREKAVLES